MDYFDDLYTGKIEARMPEFIFRRKHFLETGGFVPFDLAMRTDNATVIRTAHNKGIYTIQKGRVSWRISGMNVSFGENSRQKYVLFYTSLVAFFSWLNDFVAQKGFSHKWTNTQKLIYLFNQGYNMRRIIGWSNLTMILRQYNEFPKGFDFVKTFIEIVFIKFQNKISGFLH